jgi:hypothetical protein
MMKQAIVYHPDPSINAGVLADVNAAERADLAAGLPPRRWTCPCGASHARGHFQAIGQHRCLQCGYVGAGGVMWDETEIGP